jgi:hypothetical protein
MQYRFNWAIYDNESGNTFRKERFYEQPRAFIFRKNATYPKDSSARCRAGVEALVVKVEVDLEGARFVEEGDRILQAAAEAADRPRHDNIEFAPGRVLQRRMPSEPRA